MRAIARIIAAGIGSTVLLAACAQPVAEPQRSEEIGKQLKAASELAEGITQVQGALAETSSELANLEQELGAAEQEVSGFVAGAQTHALGRSADIPEPPEGQVALRLSFVYLPEVLPGEGIQSFESTDEVNTLWAMESLPAGASLPVGDPVPEGTLFFEPGEEKTVTLAYTNPTSEEVAFLVLPHQESPGQLAAFVWPTCLCMSFVYEAPASGAWYRVIKITMSPETPPGSKVDALWTVLTDSSVFPEE